MPTIEHMLPGEGANDAWFHRLNAFEQAETRRQVTFKRKRWPNLAPGPYSKHPEHLYPHILPGNDVHSVLYPQIADDVIAYCNSEDIAIHTEACNLRSSQVCCFNVMFPYRQDLSLARHALAPLLPNVTDVQKIEFEYTGPEGATAWLGEPKGGKRGQNRTSIDVAVWWRSAGERRLTLGEWKYTERAFGTCGGYTSNGNGDRHACRTMDVRATADPASRCYLAYGREQRRYWKHLREAGIDLSAFAGVKGCPFMGPFYQLMRQFLLAAYLRDMEDVDEVDVASIGFAGNSSLHRPPVALQHLASTVEDAWNRCLTGMPHLRCVDVQDLVAAERAATGATPRLDYLRERYGL